MGRIPLFGPPLGEGEIKNLDFEFRISNSEKHLLALLAGFPSGGLGRETATRTRGSKSRANRVITSNKTF